MLSRAYLEAAYVAFATVFDMSLATTPTMYEQVAQVIYSTQEVIKFPFLGSSPKMRKWTGDRPMGKLQAGVHQMTTEWYANGLECSQDDILLDSQTFGFIPGRIAALAGAARTLYDELVCNSYVYGFDATAGLCFDGQYLWDTDHRMDVLGTTAAQSNLQTGGIDSTNFNAAMVKGMKLKWDNGETIAQTFDKLVHGPDNALAARTLLTTAYGANGASNVNQNVVQAMLWARIPGSQWWIQSSGPERAVVLAIHTPAQFAAIVGDNSMEAFMRRNELYGAHTRVGVALAGWYHAVGSAG